MTFKKVDPRQSLPKLEEEVLKFWDENKIFEKSVEKNSAEKPFIFYEGPPTANGRPGLHHVLARSFKDIIPRYKTMKGYRVERKAGWDTHGLPVELQVEKALGLKSKQEIENIVPGDVRASIIKFNEECKKSVWEYRDLWEKLTHRMAYWVDMEHPYVTYENHYIESVWWQLSEIAKLKSQDGEDMLYRGHKVVPYCYRCGTALSSHEVAQGYKLVKDLSVTVEFKLKNPEKIGLSGDVYLLAWTTTPWTLPGNVALAVGKEVDYSIITRRRDSVDRTYILAKIRTNAVFQRDLYDEKGFFSPVNVMVTKPGPEKTTHSLVKEIKGQELVDLEYEPLFDYYATDTSLKNHENGWKIYHADFVTTDVGTGIAHEAPAYGEDDMNLAQEVKLPVVEHVNADGTFKESVADFPGLVAKPKDDPESTDVAVIKYLAQKGVLFAKEKYEHEYPFCWRCDTPLVYFAKPSWFIRMSTLRDELNANNQNVSWVPDHIKEGRFGEWLRGVKDWAISRERYWGTPIPIWNCNKCGKQHVVSSQKELTDLSGMTLDDLHKPYIDEVEWTCECGGTMKRTPEVMDVWFDSGSMPLAQFNYPAHVDPVVKEKIETGKYFPADYICEAIDQTRGWFYTLHAIATLLHEGKKVPTGNSFKNVICLGHILDAQGKKMSKSKGNVIDPFQMFDEYGADPLRWMLFSINQPGLPKRFDVKGMRDVMNRVFRMLWNSYSFFVMYATVDKWEPSEKSEPSKNLLDRWILSELAVLVREVDQDLEKYDVYAPTQKIESFIDNLSNWYIRRSRRRFWKSEDDTDKNAAYATLHEVLVTLAKVMAPFTPFITEEIYRNLTSEESVHLAEWPTFSEKLVDTDLMQEMHEARLMVSLGLQCRADAKVKARQPLGELRISNSELRDELKSIVTDELNVRSVTIVQEKDLATKLENAGWRCVRRIGDKHVCLNPEITPDLKLEGEAREIIRAIQEGRKKAGFNVEDRIVFGYTGKDAVFDNAGLKELVAREVLATSVEAGELSDAEYSEMVKIEEEDFSFSLKR